MLWSPNEVLAYLQEDSGFPNASSENQPLGKLGPTEPYGGFHIWPSSKDDFILIAENSEIHGPNPLFTIPELDPSIDLNSLSTQILSADYQGLSNNKQLPGNNAQLLMPDLASDLHAAIIYFFLFDSEARGFVRPTCVAYFTADKFKLVRLTKSIFKQLSEVAAVFQHSNIVHHTTDLRNLRDAMQSAALNPENSISKGIAAETRLKDIQGVLDIVENYKGNELFDKQTSNIMEYLKTNTNSKDIQNIHSSLSKTRKTSPNKTLASRSTTKKSMKNLYLICNSGLVLALYHLYIMHKYFRRKYENIAMAEAFTNVEGTLYFGACVKTSIRVPSIPILETDNYFECLDSIFDRILIKFFNWGNGVNDTEAECVFAKPSLHKPSTSNFQSNFSNNSIHIKTFSELEKDVCQKISFGHIVPLNMIWDILDYLTIENPDIEVSFLKVLKLFDDTQKLLFSVFTRVPVVVISTLEELHTAENFIKALSAFIPRSKDETFFVDFNRQLPLKREHLPNLAAVNFCLSNQAIENLIPLELMSSLCILNLKDFSLTGPRYFGKLLATVNQQIRVLSSNGPVFPTLVSVLLEIERTVKWWHMLTSSSADSSSATKYVLSKGYNRLDMQIIEKLSRLCRR